MSLISGEETVIFNKEVLLHRVEGDVYFLIELIDAFFLSQKESVEEMHKAIRQAQPLTLESQAHSLKGAVQNFATGKIVELAHALELMGRKGDLTSALDGLEQLEGELTKVKKQLVELKRTIMLDQATD